MRRLLASLALSVIACAGPTEATATEPNVTVTTPVFGQLVSYTLPVGFVGAFEDSNEELYIQELVPEGETVEAWSQMITLTGAKGAALRGDRPLDAAAGNLLARFQGACPDSLTSESFGPSTLDGRETLTVFLGCGTVETAQGTVRETAVITFIKGETDVYSLQWAEHAEAQVERPVYDRDTWTARLPQLLPVKICDRVEGEVAPYPSCIAKE